MRRLLPTLIFYLVFAGPAISATVDVGGGLTLEVSVPPGWSLLQEAPSPLLEEIADHIGHEAEAQGASPTEAQLLEAARKRMAANEAFLYHDASGAHLDIDFSPLDAGEKAPRSRVLRDSARYAVQSLEGEEGVGSVAWEIDHIEIDGARDAYLLSADYMHHGEPVRFLGVIGFVPDQWFFFYYTDYLASKTTYGEMQQVLGSLRIRPAGQ